MNKKKNTQGPIRTAIIGTGFIGPAHLEALKRIGGVEIRALVSKEPERAGEIARVHGIPSVSEDWREVIRDPSIDVIHNCTPNYLHYEINKAAILAGKHVISEKPLTMNSQESEALVALAKETGVVNAIVFNYRYYPLIEHARELVRKGGLGTVALIHGHYLQDWLCYESDYNWRIDPRLSGESRAVADIGSHLLDLVQHVTGLRIVSVFADLVTVYERRTKPEGAIETFKAKEKKSLAAALAQGGGRRVRIETEDAGAMIVRFHNGAQGVFSVSQVSAGRKNFQWFEIDGSACAISWNQEEPNELWIGHRERANEVLMKDPALLSETARRFAHYPGGHPEGYPDAPKNLFRQVYDFIRSGRDPRRTLPAFPTFADGHRAVKVVEAAVRSSRMKQWVDIEGCD